MRKTLIALAGSALAAAVGAQTPPASPPVPPMRPQPGMGLMAADANHDGVVTREEYLADAARRFAQMDADHDGHVTASERDAYREAMRDRRIADGAAPPARTPSMKADGVRPGHRGPGEPGGGLDMTRDDYMARAAERFDRMDANHDGRIDRTEIANMREMRHERRDGDAPPPPPPAAAR